MAENIVMNMTNELRAIQQTSSEHFIYLFIAVSCANHARNFKIQILMLKLATVLSCYVFI
jgi:hypothetical protein